MVHKMVRFILCVYVSKSSKRIESDKATINLWVKYEIPWY